MADSFTITDGGRTLTIEFEDPRYISFTAQHGTPTDYFTIQASAPGTPATFLLRSTGATMQINEAGDYIFSVLKQIAKSQTA